MREPIEWLSLHGDERKIALEEAASLLLRDYRIRYHDRVPIELNCLSRCINARIERVNGLASEALLLPISGGFRVLVRAGLAHTRARSCIAHELAHTLFYCSVNGRPSRLKKPSNEEEIFCLDVARRILAPSWMLASLRASPPINGREIFSRLLERCGISRDIAAQVMLQDYMLIKGVAGRWRKALGSWILEQGRFYASPGLTAKDRRYLRTIALDSLERGRGQDEPIQVTIAFEASAESAFVLVEAPASAS